MTITAARPGKRDTLRECSAEAALTIAISDLRRSNTALAQALRNTRDLFDANQMDRSIAVIQREIQMALDELESVILPEGLAPVTFQTDTRRNLPRQKRLGNIIAMLAAVRDAADMAELAQPEAVRVMGIVISNLQRIRFPRTGA